MIDLTDLLIVLSETAIVVLGGVLVYISLRAYRRTKNKSMLALSLGFAVIIIEPLVEELFLDIFKNPMLEAHILRNFIVAVGLLIILYSIYGNRR